MQALSFKHFSWIINSLEKERMCWPRLVINYYVWLHLQRVKTRIIYKRWRKFELKLKFSAPQKGPTLSSYRPKTYPTKSAVVTVTQEMEAVKLFLMFFILMFSTVHGGKVLTFIILEQSLFWLYRWKLTITNLNTDIYKVFNIFGKARNTHFLPGGETCTEATNK